MTSPTPLKTILCPIRYPFAVAMVKNGKIVSTVAYPETLEECYHQVMGWRSARPKDQWIMAEQQEIGEATLNQVNTYWVAV